MHLISLKKKDCSLIGYNTTVSFITKHERFLCCQICLQHHMEKVDKLIETSIKTLIETLK